jgi:tetratricopeptide (TPR) repeat protein
MPVGRRVAAACALWLRACGRTEPSPEPRTDLVDLALQGSRLEELDAAALERALEGNPLDLSARAKLLGYYGMVRFTSATARNRRQTHVLWVIRNQPECELAGGGFMDLLPRNDEDYAQGKAIWLEHARNHPAETGILKNAAAFLSLEDPADAEALLKKGAVLEPHNPTWDMSLGHLHQLGMVRASPAGRRERAAAALADYQRALRKTCPTKGLLRWAKKRVGLCSCERDDVLPSLTSVALEADQIDEARRSAQEILERGREEERHDPGAAELQSTMRADGAHKAHIVLGRLALRAGDLATARAELLAAGHVAAHGSPVLMSFGPDMKLADELLERGERETVLQYFELCRAFWTMGAQRLGDWGRAVRAGGRPDFGPSLNR